MNTSSEENTEPDSTKAGEATLENTGEGEEQVEVEVMSTEASESEQTGELACEEEDLTIEVEVVVSPLDEANNKIAELEKGKAANFDRLLRATADLENVRKRSRKEVKDARLDEKAKVLRDMLPVIDNLERAAIHAKDSETEATRSILEGVSLVIRQFEQALERHKVTRLDSVGKVFDPAIHEAVSQAPSAEHPPGTVITALQTGYMMEQRLLRPALVVVSIAMPESAVVESSDASVSESEDAGEGDSDPDNAVDTQEELSDPSEGEKE